MEERGCYLVDSSGLQPLITSLRDSGYAVIAPVERGGAVMLDAIQNVSELPVGVTEEQAPGRYRLKKTGGKELFAHTVGPQSWKNFLFPFRESLFTAKRDGHGFSIDPPPPAPKMAFLGVRPCDVAAIRVHDRVLKNGDHADSLYTRRREGAFIIAVNCTRACGSCFCVSMGTGPGAKEGFDIALTEISAGNFTAQSGSEAGKELIKKLSLPCATPDQEKSAGGIVQRAAGEMGRALDTAGIKELFYTKSQTPQWDEVATRCTSCGNCTTVCPTCFCTTVEDVTDLAGETAGRDRMWDSCFTKGHSYIHGGSIRQGGAARYRQWITHKLASWIDQFGTSGCVGCGRCITWCPVGIDITEETARLRQAKE